MPKHHPTEHELGKRTLTEQQIGLLKTALTMAIDEWRKIADDSRRGGHTRVGRQFTLQAEQAGALLDLIETYDDVTLEIAP